MIQRYAIFLGPFFRHLLILKCLEVFLELIDEMSPGVIKIQTPFLYVIMPMRVSA